MAFQSHTYRVLIASPSDLTEEREAATRAVNEWNALNAAAEGVVLLPIKWETHATPEAGVRPQEAVNKQLVRDADILVGLFWTKIGTPTGVAESGTVEEIDQCVTAAKPTMLYFSNRPIDPGKIDLDQYHRLKAFKKDTYSKALVGNFTSPDELRQTLLRDLTNLVRRIRKVQQPTLHPQEDADQRRRDQCESLRSSFEQALIDNKHKVFRGKRGVFALSIIPLTPLPKSLQLGHDFVTRNMGPLAPLRVDSGDPVPAARSMMFRYTKRAQYEENAVTEITVDGQIYAVDHWIDYNADDKDPDVVMPLPIYLNEPLLVQGVSRYLKVLKQYGVVGPWLLGMSLLHCRNYQIYPHKAPSPLRLTPPYTEDHIRTDSVIIPDTLDPANKPLVGAALCEPLNQLWRSFGYMDDPSFDDEGNFIARM